jgi:hypothetical protein
MRKIQMNERIRELAEQAELHLELQSLKVEKFAELIVKECLNIVEKNESEMHYDNGMYPVHPTVCEIKEHFGVEE